MVVDAAIRPSCEKCQFWHRGQSRNCFDRVEPKDALLPMGSCLCPKFQLGYNLTSVDFQPDEVHVENDEGWGFYTGPRFGCVHFERKEIPHHA